MNHSMFESFAVVVAHQPREEPLLLEWTIAATDDAGVAIGLQCATSRRRRKRLQPDEYAALAHG
jgi:hypothetical protein